MTLDAAQRELHTKSSSLTPKTDPSYLMLARAVELFLDRFCDVANLGKRRKTFQAERGCPLRDAATSREVLDAAVDTESCGIRMPDQLHHRLSKCRTDDL